MLTDEVRRDRPLDKIHEGWVVDGEGDKGGRVAQDGRCRRAKGRVHGADGRMRGGGG